MNSQYFDTARYAIDCAKDSGADEVAVNIISQRKVDMEYRNQQIETLMDATQHELSIDIYRDRKYSSHSTNDLRRSSLKIFVEQAVTATGYLEVDAFRALPPEHLYPDNLEKPLDIRDVTYEKRTIDQRIELIKAIEASAREQDKNIISVTAGCGDRFTESLKVHSNGFIGERKATTFIAGAEVTMQDRGGERPADYSIGITRHQKELPSADSLATEAVRRASQKLGQRKIKSGVYPMVVENRAGQRLVSMLYSAMTARSLQQKHSFLEGKLDRAIASELLTLIDDPFVPGGLSSRVYDGEGLATQKRVVIEKGVLSSYFVDTYYGRKLGMEPTNADPSNGIFEPGEYCLDQFIEKLDRGIVVTGFIGGNSNSTTGDFSFGISGLLVEQGRVIQPVYEMNISGNALELWRNLSQVGNDPYLYSSLRVPTLLFENVHFSGD